MNKINFKKQYFFFVMLIINVFVCLSIIYNLHQYNILTNQYNQSLYEIQQLESQNKELKNDYDNNISLFKKTIENKEKTIQKLNKDIETLNEKLENIKRINHKPAMNTYNKWELTWEEVNISQSEIDFWAKLLKAESGGMGYEGQFWTASAILNLSKRSKCSISTMGHNINTFAVAPFVDNVKPDDIQYQIIYNILNNGWIKDVCYFRTDHPHNFGRFMKKIENVCFSAPN